jgi:methionyl-tRNA formyltransferase
VAAVVTQPARAGEGPGAHQGALRSHAAQFRIPILEFENVNTAEARRLLAQHAPDLFVVADYGQILGADTLAVAPRGGLNVHASLLPKYRGAAPIQWAIYHGETETGVTVIQMTPRVDAGPWLARVSTQIGPAETAVELEQRLAELGAELVCRVIADLAAGTAQPIAQDASQATPARRLRKGDGAVDWSRAAAALKNQVRAMEPWPRTYTFWHRPKGESVRLILGKVAVACGQSPLAGAAPVPGTVLLARGEDLVVAAGAGALAVLAVQPAGKKMLSTAEFLRGYPVAAGDRFGPAPEPSA